MKMQTADDHMLPIRETREGECITVFFTPLKTGEKRNFRCLNCGKLLFQYESEIGLIIDSAEVPENKGPIDSRCPRCHLIYRLLW